MTKTIHIIGATGMLGLPVCRQFVEAGYEVKALVRDKEKAKKILPDQVQLFCGDLQDAMILTSFIKDADQLYINLNLKQSEKPNDFHAEKEGLQKIISLAQANHIKKIGFISSLVMNYQGMNNFHWWVFQLKHEAVDMLKASGIPYLIFYPSTFMENFHHTYRRGNRILLAGKSNYKMYFIAGKDYAKQVVNAFNQPDVKNKEYVIQGPEGLTAEEAALIFQKHYSKEKLRITKAPLGLLKLMGHFSQQANYGAHIIEALNNYPEKFEAQPSWDELGKPTLTLRDFAQGQADHS